MWLASCGGSRSVYIYNLLKRKYNMMNRGKDPGVHYMQPLPVKNVTGVFAYVNDIAIAMSCQIRRRIHKMNFEKQYAFDYKIKYTVPNWLDVIDQQISNWTTSPCIDVVIINADELDANKKLFKKEFGIDVTNFSKSRTTKEVHKDLHDYKDKIAAINKKLNSLPNFGNVSKSV